MQLTPRYGTDPVIVMDGSLAAVCTPAVRQRQRLGAILMSFDDAQWEHASRCAGWSAKDVIVHLDSTNFFWTSAITAGLRGAPTRFLATFDPVASPAAYVAGVDVSPAEVLERFMASTDTLVELLRSLDNDDWSQLAEAPPGHISISAVIHHALWDSWVHERDILLPQGITGELHDDEITACLRYAVALGPALAINSGAQGAATLMLDVADPEVRVTARIGGRVEVTHEAAADADLVLTGDAVDVLEALSIRRPLTQPIPPQHAWLVAGLATIFDVPAA